jgi:cytochrome P450
MLAAESKAVYDRGNGVDILSTVSIIPPARTFVVSDADAIKFIAKERYRFMKPLAIYAALGMFGMNVGITEGSDWTRHRRIVAGPTFAETTNRRAWDETMLTMEHCLDDWKLHSRSVGGRQEVVVPSVVTLMLKIALFVGRRDLDLVYLNHQGSLWRERDSVSTSHGKTMRKWLSRPVTPCPFGTPCTSASRRSSGRLRCPMQVTLSLACHAKKATGRLQAT